MNSSWFKRRWYNFRLGHNIYLIFLLSFTNFLVIMYTFVVSQIPLLNWVFPSIIHFAVIGAFLYIPLAVIVGHFHTKKQLPTDAKVAYKVILDRIDELEKKLRK